MNPKSSHKWVRLIQIIWDEELDCEQFFELVPQYVDAEIDGEEVNQRFPKVKRHLERCPECYDLYLGLRDAALAERQYVATELVELQIS